MLIVNSKKCECGCEVAELVEFMDGSSGVSFIDCNGYPYLYTACKTPIEAEEYLDGVWGDYKVVKEWAKR